MKKLILVLAVLCLSSCATSGNQGVIFEPALHVSCEGIDFVCTWRLGND